MTNLSIDNMRECLEHCHGVEEDYLIPALVAADGDPKKFEKVLNYFTGDRYQKFTDPNIRHSAECQIPYLLMPDRFALEINMGNSAMQGGEDLIDALTQLGERLGCMEYMQTAGTIQDRNGGTVGKWELK